MVKIEAVYFEKKSDPGPWKGKMLRVVIRRNVAHLLKHIQPREHLRSSVAQDELAATERELPAALLALITLRGSEPD
jgi:hypothetical protein